MAKDNGTALTIAVIPVAIIGLVGMLAALAALNGLAISLLWGWFVVPTFGLPAISIPVAIGLGMLRASHTPKAGTDKDFFSSAAALFVAPMMTIGLGYLVHLLAQPSHPCR